MNLSQITIISTTVGSRYFFPFRRNEVAFIVNKRVWNAVFGCSLKNNRMISVCFQDKPFSHTVIQVYAPTTNAKEAEVQQLYNDLEDLLELPPKKDILLS